MYPDDKDFEEVTIEKVNEYKDSWEIKRSDGFSFSFKGESGVVPNEGDTCRFYGKGIGYQVRGLFINGQKVFYRTESEQKEHNDHNSYGTVPEDVLRKWDEGGTIWSITMGGLGPGYEQALQVCAMEILRQMIQEKVDHSGWEEDGAMREYSNTLHDKIGDRIKPLGVSGAQFGAALNIAARIYKYGPRKFAEGIPEDRKIQVSSHWPRIESAA